MTVYADSLFLINFISEYMMLILTEKLTAIKIKRYRKTVATLAGSIVSVLIFCIDIPYFLCGILKTINIMLIICISYMCNKRAIIRAVPIFIIISFLYSGIISSIAGIISSSSIIKNGITYININEALFAVLFIITYPIVFFAAKLIKKVSSQKIYKIKISKNTYSVTLTALFDSGNLLTEQGKSVIIAEWDSIQPLFNVNTYENLYEHMTEFNLKLLPFNSLGSCGKTVILFYADHLLLTENNSAFNNVPVGIINSRISSKGSYNALIGKEYI